MQRCEPPASVCPTAGGHSQRMAVIGSIRADRSAGNSEAALAIIASAKIEPANTHGSRVDVPYRKLASARDASSAATTPIAVPVAATVAFWKNTIATTWLLCAPSAMRIPISLVRRAVAYASVP